ncbi:MAG: sensor domain-containing protein, partial [Planctomycetota bacterium]
ISLIHLFWVVYGVPLALVSCLFVIGVPLCLLFTGSMRALALVEFRLTEMLLGERMPRRPVFVKSRGNVLTKFADMIKDGYTWKTLLYLILMIPMGLLHGVIILLGFGTVAELFLLPIKPEWSDLVRFIYGSESQGPGPWGYVVTIPLGFLVYICVLHLVLYVGRLHGRLVKRLMVGVAPAFPSNREEGSSVP